MKKTEAQVGVGTLHQFVRRPDPWTESMLITEHGTVYTIRDRFGCEREIQHPRTGKWERESRVTFSQLPIYEDYHREQYLAAKPYTPNPTVDARRAKRTTQKRGNTMSEPQAPVVASNSLFGADDELIQQAHEVVWAMKHASTSVIQRRLRIGYIRASYIIEELERRGVVGPFRKDAPREVLLSPNTAVTGDRKAGVRCKGVVGTPNQKGEI